MKLPWKVPLLLGGIPSDTDIDPEQLLAQARRYSAAGCDILCVPAGLPFDKLTALVGQMRALAPACKIAGVLPPSGQPLDAEDDTGQVLLACIEHFRQMALTMAKAKVDLLLCAGMSGLNEARAALLAARKAELPVLITLSLTEEAPGGDASPLLAPVITLQALGAAAIGLFDGPDIPQMAEWLAEALPYAAVPLIAVPSVQTAEGSLSPLAFSEQMQTVLDAGAVILGSGDAPPEHAAVLRGLLDRHPIVVAPEIDTEAAAGEQEAFFLSEDLQPSPPLPCDSWLGDALIEAEESYNVARVHIAAPEDIAVFLEYAPLSRLPLAVYTDDAQVLSSVLLQYPGRLLVDSLCEIESILLEDLAAFYGAIVF